MSEELTTGDVLYLPLEKCIERSCGDRVRYSELTDDLNIHWHRSGVQFVSLAAHDAEVGEKAWDDGFVRGWQANHVAEKAFNPYRSYEGTKRPWEHPGHSPVQNRDGKPPWCRECGWSSPRPATVAQKLGKPRHG